MAKKKFISNSLWWLDVNILNTQNTLFMYLKESNIFILQIQQMYYYYFSLITKNNLNILYFYNLDGTLVNLNNQNVHYLVIQSIVADYKVLIKTSLHSALCSLSQIYPGNTWIEREIREFYSIFFINLCDSRKLLSNYNYNKNLNYNQFNQILSDINI